MQADVGIKATKQIMTELIETSSRKTLSNGEALLPELKRILVSLVAPLAKPIHFEAHKPFVLLAVGINGSGKTTTIAKLAAQLQAEGKSVLLAAGDTFRAAAIEQLQKWGERTHTPVIAQKAGADSASVIFDAINAAKSRESDVIIADTAGRLHTQRHLMVELQKIKRVITKCDASAPFHEILLVLDASIGQNALSQMQEFHEALGVTGICMTKLDGTAKGGILFALAREHGIPFRFIGLGEGVDDLPSL